MRTQPLEDTPPRGPRPRKSIHSYSMDGDRIYWLRSSPGYENEGSGMVRVASNEDISISEEELNVQDESDKISAKEVKDHSGFKPSFGWKPEYTGRKHSVESVTSHRTSPDSKSPKNKGTPNKIIQHKNNSIEGEFSFMVIGAAGVAILATIFFFYQWYTGFPGPLTKEGVVTAIKNIRGEFPSQPSDTWYKFSAGIKKIDEDPSHPSVFLLLHDTEEGTSACLAWMIAKVATRFLNATKQLPLFLEGEDLGKNYTLLNDYGLLIDEKQHEVEEHRSVIVTNLHKIPAEVARSFHSFCDVETPLVDKAVYFFTLKAAGASKSADKPTRLAETVLYNLWGKELSTDILQPLIVRITDTVLVVNPEKETAPSCQR